MIALDTNILIRILTRDDADQSQRAATFVRRQDRVFILKTVLLETEWMLRSSYGFDREAITVGLRSLVGTANFQIEDEKSVLEALSWYEQGMDFADALHLASVSSETEFATFDASCGELPADSGSAELSLSDRISNRRYATV
jgi:predicted nucleic-acid-binding protein